MKRIYYSGGSILTSDALANAVMAYAGALAKSPLADIVDIPVVLEPSGEAGMASLLIGPASQVMAVPERAGGLLEPTDEGLVDELERRRLLIGAPRPVTQEVGLPTVSDEFD